MPTHYLKYKITLVYLRQLILFNSKQITFSFKYLYVASVSIFHSVGVASVSILHSVGLDQESTNYGVQAKSSRHLFLNGHRFI